VAESLYEWFRDNKNKKELQTLLKEINIIEPSKIKTKGPLSGLSVVITGTLSSMSRDEAKEKVRKAGGKPVSSVSVSTSFVLSGENPGSKVQKAEELGVEIINEEEFLKRIEE
jgi:DNA ligase (NAD+)